MDHPKIEIDIFNMLPNWLRQEITSTRLHDKTWSATKLRQNIAQVVQDKEIVFHCNNTKETKTYNVLLLQMTKVLQTKASINHFLLCKRRHNISICMKGIHTKQANISHA